MIKSNKGITMVSLVIVVIVMAIIFGITANAGIETMEEAKVKDKITVLSMIKAKAMGYQEKVNFQAGIDGAKLEAARTAVYEGEAELVKIEDSISSIPGINTNNANYYVPKVALDKMGINKNPEDNEYIISFNDQNLTVEVYLSKGYVIKGNDIKYSLTELEGLEM